MGVPRLLVVNEYRGEQGPVAALISDFLDSLCGKFPLQVSFLARNSQYIPGGLGRGRLVNLLYLHGALPFVLFFFKLRSLLMKEPTLVLATTSPPLIQWSVIGWAWLLRLPYCVWYLDAHPELEARILEKKRIISLPRLLRFLDRFFMRACRQLVTLDQGMKDELQKKLSAMAKVQLVPPWKTYIEPAKPLRIPQGRGTIKLVYAGNLGAAHNLADLCSELCRLSPVQQKNVSLHFVGMQKANFLQVKQQLHGFVGELHYRERFAHFAELSAYFEEFDFGIVSLDHFYAGLACPSKVYSYLSQGLPVLFSGPRHSLAGTLVSEGWGYFVAPEFFAQVFAADYRMIKAQVGQVFPNPRAAALRDFTVCVEGLLR